MSPISLDRVHLRKSTGSRIMGSKLCLINLARREAWICGGISAATWAALKAGKTAQEIAELIAARYCLPVQKVLADTVAFVEHVWQRQLIDIPSRADITDADRAAAVSETPHNQSGRMY